MARYDGSGNLLQKLEDIERQIRRHDVQEWGDVGDVPNFVEEHPIQVTANIFTLSYTPNPLESLELTRDGVMQKYDSVPSNYKQGYTISGSSITLNTALEEGEYLYARYRR